MSYSVAKNTSFFTVASILQKAVSFVYFAIIARLVGVENTGLYFFAIAYVAVFIVLADFGLGTTYTREAAKNPVQASAFLNTLISAKIVFGIFTYFLVILSVNLLRYPDLLKNLIYLAGITMIFDNIHNLFFAFFRSRNNLIFESAGIVMSQILTLVIGTIALLCHWPLYWLILAYAIPSFINLIYVIIVYQFHYQIKFVLSFELKVVKDFLIMAWPFALAGAIMRLYNYSDSFIISRTLNAQALGLWGVAFKMTSAFSFIAIAVSSSVYPVFSSGYANERAIVIELFQKTYRYLFFIAFPLTGGIIALALPIMNLVYGKQFLESILPIQIMIISLVFTFLAFINGALLNAINRQKINTAIIFSALVISVIFNLILIPRFQILGAAIVFTITSIWLTGLQYIYCKKYLFLKHNKIFKYFNQTFWPALIMSVLVIFLAQYLHYIITIPIGAAIYFSLTYLFGGWSKKLLREATIKIM